MIKGAVLGSEPHLKCATQAVAAAKVPLHSNKELNKRVVLTEAAWRRMKLQLKSYKTV